MPTVEPFIPYSYGPWLMAIVIIGMVYAIIITFDEPDDGDIL